MSPTKTPNAAGSFELSLDGARQSAYVRSCEGGFLKAAVIDESVGPDILHIKHTSTIEIEPFAFEVGLAGSHSILKWIQSSWKKEYTRKHGHLIHGDFNHKGIRSQEFSDALITETTFPALDATSREQPYLKLKMLAEAVKYEPTSIALKGVFDRAQKEWSLNSFRLIIDDIETNGVSKIEAFTVKQGVKRLYTGGQRLPQIEPTKIEFPNLVVSIAEANSSPIFAWYKNVVVNGQPEPAAGRTGAIEFLSPDRKRVMLHISLANVGIASATLVASQGNQNATKMCKFELYVGSMEIDFAASKGLS
jgi:hypothetical protein